MMERSKILADFGTRRHPLRASGLGMLVKCPLRSVVMALGIVGDGSGKEADTGSLFHVGVKQWHTNGMDLTQAVQEVEAHSSEFPRGDTDDATRLLSHYAADRQNQTADIVLMERQVELVLPAAAHDPTGEDIVIQGRLDQARRTRAGVFVWDLKTSKRYGEELLAEHTTQLAAYTLGAEKLIGEPVSPGGIIRARDYTMRSPGRVFHSFDFPRERLLLLLDAVRNVVADVRRGAAAASPGPYCSWGCPMGHPRNCTLALTQVKGGMI